MMWWGHEFSWGWSIFGWVMMLLFWGGAIAIVILDIRSFTRQSGQQASGFESMPAGGRSAPLEILRERYARGEITKTEYEAIREDLTG